MKDLTIIAGVIALIGGILYITDPLLYAYVIGRLAYALGYLIIPGVVLAIIFAACRVVMVGGTSGD